MTDQERFDRVLLELGDLLVALRAIGLGDDAVLIGAQVVAIEQLARKQTPFLFQTAHGLEISRGFSFEPDLVIDSENEQALEQLPEVLKQQGFERTGRSATWAKRLDDGFTLELDLFRTAEDIHPPTVMTLVKGAPRFQVRVVRVSGTDFRLPRPYTWLSMKLEAKLRLRPEHTKDSLDLYAYAEVVGADEINQSLAQAGPDGARVRRELHLLFGEVTAPGVRDVLDAAAAHASAEERALLAQGIVDAFARITKSA